MKKLFFLTAAFATMLFASCEKEEMAPVAKETTVTYTVELPSVQTKAGTKAIGDGFNVDQLVYEVWKTEVKGERDLKDPAKATRLYQETVSMSKTDGEQKCVVTLNLVHDQNYTILFWAQNDAADAYNTDLLTEVKYAKTAYDSNVENMAAFYGVEFLEAEEIEKSGPMRRTELKRPFAQLNIATMNTVDANEYKVQLNKSKVKVSNVPTVFDVAQNTPSTPAVTDEVAFTFNYAALPQEVLTVNNKAYDHYVAMNYMFAPNGEGDVTVEYWIDATLIPTDVANDKTETPAIINNTVINVPLKENYRTNIVGNLLSSTTQYEVVIDARWNDPSHYIELPDTDDPVVDNCYKVYTAQELAKWAYVANKIDNTARLEIMQDITLPAFEIVEDAANETYKFSDTPITFTNGVPSSSNWIPVGSNAAGMIPYAGNANGNGHTISGLYINDADGYAGLFGQIDGGDSQENAVNSENIFVGNIKIANSAVCANGSAVGAIAGYVRNIKSISNCHVSNCVVKGTSHAGGIVGYLYTRQSDKNIVLTGCSTDANSSVYGTGYVGGLVGTNYGSIVINSTNSAYVENKGDYAGGIAGYSRDYQINRSAYIIACTNNGNVISTSKYVGGITGYNLCDVNHTPSESSIVACSSVAADLKGKDNDKIGLLVGRAYANSGTVINNYHYGSWALKTSSVSALVNNGGMTSCFAYGSVAEISQADVDEMNAAIATYNAGRSAADASYCPYTWILSSDNTPVLVK